MTRPRAAKTGTQFWIDLGRVPFRAVLRMNKEWHVRPILGTNKLCYPTQNAP